MNFKCNVNSQWHLFQKCNKCDDIYAVYICVCEYIIVSNLQKQLSKRITYVNYSKCIMTVNEHWDSFIWFTIYFTTFIIIFLKLQLTKILWNDNIEMKELDCYEMKCVNYLKTKKLISFNQTKLHSIEIQPILNT